MLRLDIDTERTKPTIVRSAQLVLCNILTRLNQIVGNLLWRLDLGVQWVRHANEGDLLHAICVATDGLSDLLVNACLVLFRRKLDEEVAGVHGEETG